MEEILARLFSDELIVLLEEFDVNPWWVIFRGALQAGAIAGALWGIVWILERAHWRDIRAREAGVQHIRISNTSSARGYGEGRLVAGSAVVAHDAVRSLSVFMRRLFGGRIRHYERLLARGRLEALNRLRAEAMAMGASRVANIRFQTVSMMENRPIVAIIVVGTAF